jgi:hypothetical protein
MRLVDGEAVKRADGALLDGRYPSTDKPQSPRLDIPYPDARADLNRGCRW